MKRQIIKPKKKAVQPAIIETSTSASPVMFFSHQRIQRRPRKLLFSERAHHYNKSHVAMPTQIVRPSLFFPSIKEIKREERTYVTPWGTWKIKGEPFTVTDYGRLLVITELIFDKRYLKPRSEVIITLYAFCKLLGIKRSSQNYHSIWESLVKFGETVINLDAPQYNMIGSLLWVKKQKKTDKIQIRPNPFFDKAFAMGLITRLNRAFFTKIKGDTAKLLYVFLQSQADFKKGEIYWIGLVKLCNALNIKTEKVPLWQLRKTIRGVIASLVNEKYLTQSSCIHTNDAVCFQQPKPKKKK